MGFCKDCFNKQCEIDRLKEKIKRLEVKVGRLKKPSNKPFGSNTPSAKETNKANTLNKNTQKQGGAPKGHKGKTRDAADKEKADSYISVELPEKCPDCGHNLESKGTYERQIIDIVAPKLNKIVYEIARGNCPCCAYKTKPVVPALPRLLLGNQLLSRICVGHYIHGIPLGRLSAIYNNQIVQGTIINSLKILNRLCKLAYPLLVNEYRKCFIRHADETVWRTDGQNGYAWLFCSLNISIFNFCDTRSSRIPLEIFGSEELEGVLVVDRYAGYNKMPVKIQYCYAHLLRKVEELQKEFPQQSEVQSFCKEFGSLLSQVMKLGSSYANSKNTTMDKYLKKAKDLESKIKSCVENDAIHLGIIEIQNIFIKNESRLYHWVTDPRVPSHNNYAEREFRPTVIARKVSHGSQSVGGAEFRSNIMSVLHTAMKRLKGPTTTENWLKNTLDKISISPGSNIYNLLPARVDTS